MEKYKEAALRHYLDAHILKESGRADNAGHLIGFAAECAIKYRIVSLRPGHDSPHGHFPEIVNTARKHLGKRSDYVRMYEILKGDVFLRWNVNRRYSATGDTHNEEVDNWFKTTRRLFATAEIKVMT